MGSLFGCVQHQTNSRQRRIRRKQLSGTLKKIKAYDIQNYVAVMDRGFFSLSNLQELMRENVSFIMAAKLQLNDLKQLMTEAQKDIDNAKYLQKFKN